METSPTVFIVDDDEAVREGLMILCKSKGVRAEAFFSAFHFLSEYDPEVPGCLVLDIRMPELDGIGLQRKLLQRQIKLPVIIISGHADVPTTVDAMKLGALDVVEKPFRNETLLQKILWAFEKDLHRRHEETSTFQAEKGFKTLSDREREVLQTVFNGLSNKEAAHELGIDRKTIEFHRKNIMKKMQVDSLAQLIQIVDPLLKPPN
jgi:two-component system, LuxR family, response regulator FixJ